MAGKLINTIFNTHNTEVIDFSFSGIFRINSTMGKRKNNTVMKLGGMVARNVHHARKNINGTT